MDCSVAWYLVGFRVPGVGYLDHQLQTTAE
jgi:hypothetical protein